MWEEILGLASSIHFTEDQDTVIWEFNTNGFIRFNPCMLLSALGVCNRSIPLWCGACWFPQGTKCFYGYFATIESSPEITWGRGEMWRINHVCSVLNLNQLNIYSLNAMLQLTLGWSALISCRFTCLILNQWRAGGCAVKNTPSLICALLLLFGVFGN